MRTRFTAHFSVFSEGSRRRSSCHTRSTQLHSPCTDVTCCTRHVEVQDRLMGWIHSIEFGVVCTDINGGLSGPSSLLILAHAHTRTYDKSFRQQRNMHQHPSAAHCWDPVIWSRSTDQPLDGTATASFCFMKHGNHSPWCFDSKLSYIPMFCCVLGKGNYDRRCAKTRTKTRLVLFHVLLFQSAPF